MMMSAVIALLVFFFGQQHGPAHPILSP